MHASIAHAIYRGEKRQFASRMEAADARLKQTTYRFGRRPWLRTAVEGLFRSPHFVTVQYSSWGEKKHEVAVMMGYLHPESLQQHDAWCASSYVFRAKNCTYERRDLPIKVSHHAVLRLMERADIANPAQALFWTVPAMQYALLAEDGPPDESVLLPCAAGAVVAVRDKEEPEDWAFVTYLDDDKLRPEQRAEVADRLRQLKEKLGATGESRVLRGQRGGRAFLA